MAKVYGGKLNAISRGLKLHRVDMKILRGIPSNEWTPIFEALTTFASYYGNFTPSGSNSTLEIAFYKQGSKIQTIAFGDASAFSIALDASDVLTFNLISNVELNGVPATSGVTTVPDGYYVLTGDLDITSDVKYYAANATPVNFFGIQIHSIKNVDNDDPSNSIDINTVKRSKDAPSASDNLLINSLGSVGEDVIINGDFEGGLNGWDVTGDGSGWSVEGGVATRDPSATTSNNGIAQDGVLENGKTYIIDFDIVGGSAGALRVYAGQGAQGLIDTGDFTPRHITTTCTITTDGVNKILFNGVSACDVSLDNISIRETTRNVGSITNLTGWEPVLKGGGLNRENVPDKFEAFNGSFANINWDGGVWVNAKQMTAFSPTNQSGSYSGMVGDAIAQDDILVGKVAVVKVSSEASASAIAYTVLQGTDEQIQKGFEYPNVFRVIKPTDTSGEYEHYNTGGAYPWKP